MLLLLFHNGATVEIEDCEDVIHLPGFLVCLDVLGGPVATFSDSKVAGYTLHPSTIQELKSPGSRPGRRRRRSRATAPDTTAEETRPPRHRRDGRRRPAPAAARPSKTKPVPAPPGSG